MRLYRLQDGGGFSFALEADTYNRLRNPKVQVPKLLAVLDMPNDEDEWLTVTVEGLMLRRRMYWVNLYGQPETKQNSKTVRIPVLQHLDVEALRQLMDDSRPREALVRIFLKDEHLLAVTPNALSAYVKSRNWIRAGGYGEYSDVYEADGRPTIVVPNTAEIGDYARVMARLLDVFARVDEAPVEKVYSDLLYADRDVIRVRVNEGGGGTLLFERGVELLNGSWNMVLASAGSLSDRRPVLSRGNSREARNFLRFVDLGQTEEGSYVITLLPPPLTTVGEPIKVTPSQVEQPSMFEELVGSIEPEDVEPQGASLVRRITRHLSETLTEVRRATEGAQAVGIRAFFEAVEKGVSANLCEALVQIIGPYDEVDVSVAWAATMPMPTLRSTSQFFKKRHPCFRRSRTSVPRGWS